MAVESPFDPSDERVAAFCNPRGPQVFSSIAYAHQLWERDPFDVPTVHAHARRAFERLLDGATSDRNMGHVLLIRGKAGSGKTHLVRAYRNHVHGRRLGFAGYMQMTANAEDYGQYALTNFIDSMQSAYDRPEVQASGLLTLSDAVAQMPGCIAPEKLARLIAGELPGEDPISPLVDDLLRHPALSGFDPDLLRVMLQLQRRDPPITARAVKYLRCLDLTDGDRSMLGGIAPRSEAGAAQRMLTDLGLLIRATTGGALVLLLDQLEDIFHLREATKRFPRVIDVVRSVVDTVPGSVVVISCLDDMYIQVRETLSLAALDRVEREPPPITLVAPRTKEEIDAIVARRLRYLYEVHEARFRPAEPLFPFSTEKLALLENLRTRDCINWCWEFHNQCMAVGRIVDDAEVARPHPDAEPFPPLFNWSQVWNDARTGTVHPVPEEDAQLLDLIALAAVQCSVEAGPDAEILTERARDDLLRVQVKATGGAVRARLAVAVCNAKPAGGALAKQLEYYEVAAAPDKPALVRSGAFPDNERTQVAIRLGQILAAGGKRVVFEDNEWRTIQAFAAFRDKHRVEPGFVEWAREEQPLSQLACLRQLFGLDDDPLLPSPLPPPPSPAPEPSPRRGSFRLGGRADVANKEVTIALADLEGHAAFLGTAGSGQAAPALRLVELALEQALPVILVDRRGELCAYADQQFWAEPGVHAQATERKAKLREQLQIAVYTPGEPRGRPVKLPIVPADLAHVPWRERALLARQAAESLGPLMGYHGAVGEMGRLVILGKTIEVLLKNRQDVTRSAVTELVTAQDPELLNATVGYVDQRHFQKLNDNLAALAWRHQELLDGDAPPLDVDALLEPGSRLSIVTTRFLEDENRVEYAISRLLVELAVWAAKNPSDKLRGLVYFEDADIYLPAEARPATKEPFLDLLRRASSAGLGILLGTERPGDLDYVLRDHVRTWLVGKVTEEKVVPKMRPLLGGYQDDLPERLSALRPGSFILLGDGKAEELLADASLFQPRPLEHDRILTLARERTTDPRAASA